MKNQRSYIIDGYNLIHKSKRLKEVFLKNPSLAREMLVSELSNFFLNRKEECYVIFDGSTNFTDPLSTPKVRVFFSSPPEKADDVIKQIILKTDTKSRKDLIVVSSDNEIINCAKACGAKRMSSEEFLRLMSERRKEIGSEEKPYVTLTEEEKKKLLGLE